MGLVYEVVWTKLLTLTIGSTIYSITTVLVAFMGGLALGSFVAGKYEGRIKNTLRTYGLLEIAIGLYALSVPLLVKAIVPIFSFLYNNYYHDQFYVFSLIRFAICALLLLVPTTLMGATLPILTSHFVRRGGLFARGLSVLYALNTFGAFMGTMVAGFILIPILGLKATILAGALTNIGIGILVIAISKFRQSQGSVAEEAEQPSEKVEEISEESDGRAATHPTEKLSSLRMWAILSCYGVSGFAAMVYQITWTRVLALSLGSSVYAFTMILSTFIAGLAFGAVVSGRVADKIKMPIFTFGVLEALVGGAAQAIVPLFGILPLIATGIFLKYSHFYSTLMVIEFFTIFGIVIIPTFLMGAIFPVVARIYRDNRAGIGKAVGVVYASNTVGAIFGSFVGGFVFIPFLHLENSIAAASFMNFTAAAVLILLSEWRSIKPRLACAFLMIVIALSSVTLIPPWDKKVLTLGPFIYSPIYKKFYEKGFRQFKATLSELSELLMYEDSVDVTISVHRMNGILYLKVNGKTDASDSTDMSTQILCAQLPILIARDPKDVLVIGLASGVTLGSVLRHPVRSVDVVELSPAMKKAYKFFEHLNYKGLDDDRTNFFIGDGRSHLAFTDKTYDVIISEPSNPWISGQGNLFTYDFFESAKSKLRPGGVLLVWVQGYSMSLDNFKIVSKTLAEVFPKVIVWEPTGTGADYLFTAINDSSWEGIDYRRFSERANIPEARKNLESIDMMGPEYLVAGAIFDEQTIKNWPGKEVLHTDDNLLLEYNAPKTLYEDSMIPIMKQLISSRKDPLDFLIPSTASTEELAKIRKALRAQQHLMNGLIYMNMGPQGYARSKQELIAAIALHPSYTDAKIKLSELEFKDALEALENQRWLEAYNVCNRIIALVPEKGEAWHCRGVSSLMQNRPQLANGDFKKSIELGFKDHSVYYSYGTTFLLLGEAEKAIKAFEASLKLSPEFPDSYNGIGIALQKIGEIDKARDAFLKAVALKPDYVEPNKNLGFLYYLNGWDNAVAIQYFEKALELSPLDKDRGKIETIIGELKGGG